MTDRLILSELATPPLRIGARFFMRQTRKRSIAMTRRLDSRHAVTFEVGWAGNAVFCHGPGPTTQTRLYAQHALDRRFCGERRA